MVPAQLIVSFELALRRFYCFLCKCQEQPSPSLSPQMRALDLREMLGDQSQMSAPCCRSVSAPCALEATLQAQVLMRPPQLPCLFHHFVFHNSRRTFSLACNMGREYEWKKVLTGLLTPPRQLSIFCCSPKRTVRRPMRYHEQGVNFQVTSGLCCVLHTGCCGAVNIVVGPGGLGSRSVAIELSTIRHMLASAPT